MDELALHPSIRSSIYPKIHSSIRLSVRSTGLAEREGFEPPSPISQGSGFQDRRNRPLCHLSGTGQNGVVEWRSIGVVVDGGKPHAHSLIPFDYSSVFKSLKSGGHLVQYPIIPPLHHPIL